MTAVEPAPTPAFRSPFPAPAPALDPYLDAAARCFARYGVDRTTVADVAREAGVTRTTVYRHVGSVDALARALFARELNAVLDTVSRRVRGEVGAGAVLRFTELAVESARRHPVVEKMLSDQPERAAALLLGHVDRIVELTLPLLEPLLPHDLGPSEMGVLAHWLVRTAIVLVLAPVPGDLRSFLDAVVRPVLDAENGRGDADRPAATLSTSS